MNNKKITLYAPCRCEVFPISQCKDEIFSNKTLGDGIFIIPKEKQFYSIVDKGEIVLIADTKHAFFIKQENGPTILMHIGLDTVKLNGKPFDVKVKQNQVVDLKTMLVEVDKKELDKEKISFATPIVLDSNENPGWKFERIKGLKVVEKGQPIGYLVQTQEVKEEPTTNAPVRKNKYLEIAQNIYELVGGSNFSSFTNCMTRFRLIINDKSLVNESEIKKISIVKGVQFNGNELQIIIGGEVGKVRDQFGIYVESLGKPSEGTKRNSTTFPTKKKGFKERILAPISGCIIPILPMLLAGGLLKGLYSILVIANAIPDISAIASVNKTEANMAAFLYFAMQDLPIAFMGVTLFISVVKYMKGDVVSASIMAILLFSPYIYGIMSPLSKTDDPGYALNFYESTQWTMFKIGDFSITFSAYTNSLFVFAASAVCFVLISRWVKSWMPGSLDIIFRMLIVLVVNGFLTFFILGPILNFVQLGFSEFFKVIEGIPYGIGAGIYAMLWQPLVLTGSHAGINAALNAELGAHYRSIILFGTSIGVVSQVGATIGVAIKTKNSELRKTAIGGIVPGFIGVTEPILYGCNLIKGKPFLYGCFGALVGGILAGNIGVYTYTQGVGGILGVISIIPTPEYTTANNWTVGSNEMAMIIANSIIVLAVSTAVPLLMTFFLYKERPNEIKATKKYNKKMVKMLLLNEYVNQEHIQVKLQKYNEKTFLLNLYKFHINFVFQFKYLFDLITNKKQVSQNQNLSTLENELGNIVNVLSEDNIKKIKEYEKLIIKDNLLNTKLNTLNDKLYKKEEVVQKKLTKLENKKNKTEEVNKKIEALNQKILFPEINEEINKIKGEIDANKLDVDKHKVDINQIHENYLQEANKAIDKLNTSIKDEKVKNCINYYYNTINSVEISYGIEDKKEIEFKLKDAISLAV